MMFIKLNYLWPSAYGNAYLERFKKNISPHPNDECEEKEVAYFRAKLTFPEFRASRVLVATTTASPGL